jgi:hypothetical protein
MARLEAEERGWLANIRREDLDKLGGSIPFTIVVERRCLKDLELDEPRWSGYMVYFHLSPCHADYYALGITGGCENDKRRFNPPAKRNC